MEVYFGELWNREKLNFLHSFFFFGTYIGVIQNLFLIQIAVVKYTIIDIQCKVTKGIKYFPPQGSNSPLQTCHMHQASSGFAK